MSTSSQPPDGGQAQPPQPAAPALPAPPGAAAPTDGQAIAALVLGILGLVGVCPIVGSIIAIVMGRSSEKRIEASGGTLGGEGLAKAGWILGIVGIALGVLFVLFFLVVLAIGAAISIPLINMDINPTPVDPFTPADILRWL
jgi:hypothetical protein